MKMFTTPALALVLSSVAVAPAFAQLGSGTPGAGPAEQIGRSATAPLPQASPAPPTLSADTWVPDRSVPNPYGGTSLVPGHWERALPNGQNYVPPLTSCGSNGACTTSPGGEYPSPSMRIGPP